LEELKVPNIPRILFESYEAVKKTRLNKVPGLRSIVLGHYFTVVELDDGNVGAAMSYYRCSMETLKDVEVYIRSVHDTDNLLECLYYKADIECFERISLHDVELILASLTTAIVSALTAPVMLQGGDEVFVASSSISFDQFAAVNSAVILGYGGYLEFLLNAKQIRHVHIIDLNHSISKMTSEIEHFGSAINDKLITFSDEFETDGRLKNADLVCITGSALSNCTMERVLNAAQGCPRIIVQGQSASIHPGALFRRGVDLVATTVKPRELVARALSDNSRAGLQADLENGLPWIYLLPQ
jgi:hypothetical protein